MRIFAVVAFASIGAWSCRYDDGHSKPVEKTSVGRATWPAASGSGAIGGGPPASSAPNAGEDQAKDFLGRPRDAPLASPPAPSPSVSTNVPTTRAKDPRRGR